MKITKKDLKGVTLEQLLDRMYGKKGTKAREDWEYKTDLMILNSHLKILLEKKRKLKK
jgi:hypothetical protein